MLGPHQSKLGSEMADTNHVLEWINSSIPRVVLRPSSAKLPECLHSQMGLCLCFSSLLQQSCGHRPWNNFKRSYNPRIHPISQADLVDWQKILKTIWFPTRRHKWQAPCCCCLFDLFTQKTGICNQCGGPTRVCLGLNCTLSLLLSRQSNLHLVVLASRFKVCEHNRNI